MVQELFKGGVYFVQLEPDNQCGNNIQGKIQEIWYVVLLHISLCANCEIPHT